MGVGYFEEEPLAVAGRVDVVLEQQVVLALGDLRNHRQVATLEAGFEDQSVILFVLLIVEGREVRVLVTRCLVVRLLGKQPDQIASPDIPVLLKVIDFLVTGFAVLPVYDVGEGSANP